MNDLEEYDLSDLEEKARKMDADKNIAAMRVAVHSIDHQLKRQEDGPSQSRRAADLLAATHEQNKALLDKQDRTNDLLSRVNAHAMGCLIVLLVIAWRIW